VIVETVFVCVYMGKSLKIFLRDHLARKIQIYMDMISRLSAKSGFLNSFPLGKRP
jgi:hypothetical protein